MKFILTIGPSLGGKIPIHQIHQESFIYRINGAHGDIQSIKSQVKALKAQESKAKILLDLPGNKVRTANLTQGIKLEKGKEFCIKSENFNYTNFYKYLKKGMQIHANDSVFLFEVLDSNKEQITFLSHSSGELLNNKGMHTRGLDDLPFLFEKDEKLIALANELKLDFVGASFVRSANNVKELTNLTKAQIICKVETIKAVENLSEILPLIEYLLIDRGDLSTKVGIENVPKFQRHIIELANFHHKKVFLATQILKNMQVNPVPTIAEIDDLYTIFKSGVYGVQLSEESAVGGYVKECIEILDLMQQSIKNEKII